MICRECGNEISHGKEIIRVSSGERSGDNFCQLSFLKEIPSIYFCAACYDGYTPEEVENAGPGWYAKKPEPAAL
jgi:hypothetical protein